MFDTLRYKSYLHVLAIAAYTGYAGLLWKRLQEHNLLKMEYQYIQNIVIFKKNLEGGRYERIRRIIMGIYGK